MILLVMRNFITKLPSESHLCLIFMLALDFFGGFCDLFGLSSIWGQDVLCTNMLIFTIHSASLPESWLVLTGQGGWKDLLHWQNKGTLHRTSYNEIFCSLDLRCWCPEKNSVTGGVVHECDRTHFPGYPTFGKGGRVNWMTQPRRIKSKYNNCQS